MSMSLAKAVTTISIGGTATYWGPTDSDLATGWKWA